MKLRHFFDHPAFVAANADAVRAARDTLPAAVRDRARVVFTAHSVPTAADAAAGTPSEGGHRYSRQVAEAARLVAAELGARRVRRRLAVAVRPAAGAVAGAGHRRPPRHAARAGVPAVVVAPVGFVSDHVEVIWDLDTEARERAAGAGYRVRPGRDGGPGPAVRGHGGRAGRRAHRRRRAARAVGGRAVRGLHRERAAVRGRLLRTYPASRRKVGPFVIVTGGRRRVRVGRPGCRAVARRSRAGQGRLRATGRRRRPGHE